MLKGKISARYWKDIRAVLKQKNSKDLLSLIGDLYSLRKENRDFLHARCLKNTSSLSPFKKTIENFISPAEPWKNPVKLSLARRAISDYKKAAGDPRGLSELMLFYSECGVNYTLEFGDIDEAYYSSVVGVFSDGLKMLEQCDQITIDELLPRYKGVVGATADIGWGFYDGLRDAIDFYFPDS